MSPLRALAVLISPLPRRLLGALFLSSLLLLAVVPCANAQETAEETETSNLPEGHSPQGALWRAAAVPGWGQLYNRQYYKIPIVWAGLGGLAASALVVNREYLLYRHAYHFLSRRVDGKPLFPEYEEDFETLIEDLGISRDRAFQLESSFKQSRDNLRRNRDLLYIGVGLFYGLTILDAYVNAHLLDFDVGEDLTLAVQPAPTGFSATLKFGH